MRIACWVLAAWVVFAASSAFAYPSPKPASAPQIQRDIHDILSAPEYNRKYSSDANKSGFIQKTLDKLGMLLRSFFNWIGNALAFKGGASGRVASFVLACLVVVGFIVLVGLIVRKLARSGRDARIDDPAYALGETFTLPSALPLINEAARLADAEDYRGAFRCAYMASISQLDDAKAIRFERGRTNWEYLRELRRGGHDASYDALRQVTVTFDRKLYGREKCNRQDYLDALAVYERITGGAGL